MSLCFFLEYFSNDCIRKILSAKKERHENFFGAVLENTALISDDMMAVHRES